MSTATATPRTGVEIVTNATNLLGPILVATDGTSSASAALKAAALMSDGESARVMVLAVLEPLPLVAADYGLLLPPAETDDARRQALLTRVLRPDRRDGRGAAKLGSAGPGRRPCRGHRANRARGRGPHDHRGNRSPRPAGPDVRRRDRAAHAAPGAHAGTGGLARLRRAAAAHRDRPRLQPAVHRVCAGRVADSCRRPPWSTSCTWRRASSSSPRPTPRGCRTTARESVRRSSECGPSSRFRPAITVETITLNGKPTKALWSFAKSANVDAIVDREPRGRVGGSDPGRQHRHGADPWRQLLGAGDPGRRTSATQRQMVGGRRTRSAGVGVGGGARRLHPPQRRTPRDARGRRSRDRGAAAAARHPVSRAPRSIITIDASN